MWRKNVSFGQNLFTETTHNPLPKQPSTCVHGRTCDGHTRVASLRAAVHREGGSHTEPRRWPQTRGDTLAHANAPVSEHGAGACIPHGPGAREGARHVDGGQRRSFPNHSHKHAWPDVHSHSWTQSSSTGWHTLPPQGTTSVGACTHMPWVYKCTRNTAQRVHPPEHPHLPHTWVQPANPHTHTHPAHTHKRAEYQPVL